MNFINKYPNGEALSAYQYAEEFMEYDPAEERETGVIYAVGAGNKQPSIIKINSGTGNVTWEKTYIFDGVEAESMVFYKIVQVQSRQRNNSGGDVEIVDGIGIGDPEISETAYIVHSFTGSSHYLMGITPNGVVTWCKEIGLKDNTVQLHLESSKTHSGFFVVLSGGEASSHLVIWAMDANGNAVTARRIFYHNNSVVNSARSHDNGITLVGHFTENEVVNGWAMDLDANLNIVFSFYIPSPSLMLQDVLVNNGAYIVSGYVPGAESLFVTGYSPWEIQPSSLYMFPNTAGYASKLCKAAGHGATFYFIQYNEDEGIVHYLSAEFLPQWTKTLQLDTGPNGISFLNCFPNTGDLTFVAKEAGIPALLVHADSDMTSCKTIGLDTPVLWQDVYSLVPENSPVKSDGPELISLFVEEIFKEPSKIECCGEGDEVPIDANTMVQSPDFYIQAAGSTGADGSAAGIHLRWIFTGVLGQKHLPKGDYATSSYNFNKPDDYVRLYKTPYIKAQAVLDLTTVPYLADDSNKVWLYRVGSKIFYVYFRNKAKYTQVRTTYNPFSNPQAFIAAYGNELIEIENKKELFFAAELGLNITGFPAKVRTETVSVAENALAASRVITSRQEYTTSGFDVIRLVCENGRSIRLKPSNCSLLRIYFECYTDFILSANNRRAWQLMDKYALSTNDGIAFTRLEPTPGLVDGKWQRYNDNAFVNIANYQDKWNGPRASWDRNIKGVVQQYINLSNAQNNPGALENVPMQSGGNPADDMLEVSNLDLLNVAAYDFHVARMLGLGTLDVSLQGTDAQFIYIGTYTTTGDLEDGDGARTVHHLAMSIPVSVNDQRLPLPVKLKEIKPGAFWGTESPDPVNLTDVNGYTPDGRMRYITLYAEQLPEDELNKPFYNTSRQFNAATFTYPVYAGLEYKKNNEIQWIRPELPNDPKFKNKVPLGELPHNETIPMVLPEAQKPLFVHRQRVSGTHYYGSYGINWFSRAASSASILSILTNIQPINPLKPPSNINTLLVRKELPLIFSTVKEQERYEAIPGDKTLIRLMFDYHTYQELINYKIPLGADINDPNIIPADNTEIFADKVEIFFRNRLPANVSGKVLTITDHPANSILSVIQTGNYVMTSTGEVLQPFIPAALNTNYVGGLFVMGDQQFVIHQVVLPTGAMQGPEFTVYKKEISNGLVTNEIPAPGTQNLESPEFVPDGLFMAIENMQNAASWGAPNPLSLTVNIGTGWTVHREAITITNDDGSTEEHLEKTRGIWGNANVEAIQEPVTGGTAHLGLYKITFQNFTLPQHAQFAAQDVSVEWSQGIIRVHTQQQPNGRRKTLNVLRLESVGSGNLIVYASDASFINETSYDKISTGIVSVNFYPGYKAYLYADPAMALTESAILPGVNEDVRYSIFGLRSHDLQENYYSRISMPALMFAQHQVEPEAPEQPQGGLYATRPDFFGRATYTFTTKYQHRPHGVLTCRADDEILLNTLYAPETVIDIRQRLKALGGPDDPYFFNRWNNFVDFAALEANGDYKVYPDPSDPDAYKFPNPDNEAFYAWLDALRIANGEPPLGQPGALPAGDVLIRKYVQRAISEVFVPLTEIPVVYQYINGGSYKPVNKKQVIRDRDGNVLKPGDTGFDMAPMMRVTGGPNDETAFTDFSLDGASNNIYFYGVRELNAQMQMSGFSPFLGPVKLVNTHPPEAPEVKRIMPVLENSSLGIDAGIQLEVNAYPEVQHVKKLNIYRALSQLDAQSVRSMKLVKTIDLDVAGITANNIWLVNDEFEDLAEVPYNDGLFYRITASRKIEYADMDGNVVTEYAPSKPSKLTATLIAEVYNPPAPVLTYASDPIAPSGELNNVQLEWDKAAYKATYHIYKMNASGNWTKIHQLTSNDAHIALLLADTGLQSGTIQTKDADNNTIYAHFKVVTENTSGMLSLEENILTIPG